MKLSVLVSVAAATEKTWLTKEWQVQEAYFAEEEITLQDPRSRSRPWGPRRCVYMCTLLRFALLRHPPPLNGLINSKNLARHWLYYVYVVIGKWLSIIGYNFSTLIIYFVVILCYLIFISLQTSVMFH